MGSQINNFFFTLCVLLLLAGCQNNNFDRLEDPNVFYQIYPGKQDILRLRQTVNAGAPLIQLFDSRGKKVNEFTIAPMGIFNITSIVNNNVEITYLIGQSDLPMFLPWFETNRSNPQHIGKYVIHYNYKIQNTFLENKSSKIDSLVINKKTRMISLFLDHQLIASKPIYLLVVKNSKFLAYDPETQSYTPFLFADKNLKKLLFDRVMSIYQD